MNTIIIGFASARSFYNAPPFNGATPIRSNLDSILSHAAPTERTVKLARAMLAAHSIPDDDLRVLDVIVPTDSDKRNNDHMRCHVWNHPLTPGSLCRLTEDVYIVSVELCALQAAQELSELALIEYYFELCSTYVMPNSTDDEYRTLTRQRTTTSRLRDFILSIPDQCRGKRKALRALRCVRDGARSPMETAMTIPITARWGLGGLQIRDLTMNYRVDLVGKARELTRRTYLVCDAFIKRGNQDIEYQGAYHQGEGQTAIDNERRAALQEMGYKVVDINKAQMFDKLAFQRVMKAIELNAGVRVDGRPEDFEARQEKLRQFVIRRWMP